MCIFINCFTETHTHTRLGWIPSALSCSLIGLFVFLYIFGLCVWVGLLFAYLLLVAGLFRLFVAGSNHTQHFLGHCPQWHTKYAPGRKAHISHEAFTAIALLHKHSPRHVPSSHTLMFKSCGKTDLGPAARRNTH